MTAKIIVAEIHIAAIITANKIITANIAGAAAAVMVTAEGAVAVD